MRPGFRSRSARSLEQSPAWAAAQALLPNDTSCRDCWAPVMETQQLHSGPWSMAPLRQYDATAKLSGEANHWQLPSQHAKQLLQTPWRHLQCVRRGQPAQHFASPGLCLEVCQTIRPRGTHRHDCQRRAALLGRLGQPVAGAEGGRSGVAASDPRSARDAAPTCLHRPPAAPARAGMGRPPLTGMPTRPRGCCPRRASPGFRWPGAARAPRGRRGCHLQRIQRGA